MNPPNFSPDNVNMATSAKGTAETSTMRLPLSNPERKKILRQIWLLPLIIMFTLMGASYYMWQWSKQELKKQHKATKVITNDLQKVRALLNKVAEEEQEIIRKSKQFQALERRGVLSPMNDLDIQEFLYAQASANHIGEFEYAFAEKPYTGILSKVLEKTSANTNTSTSYQSDSEKVKYKIMIKGVGQMMTFKMQHEVQLLRFLKLITANVGPQVPPVLVSLKNCHIKRINAQQPLSPTQYNFSALCNIDWITLVRKRL